MLCAITQHMKDWSCERLVLVINAFSQTAVRIIGPHLGESVDEDAVVKLDVLKQLQYTDAQMGAVSNPTCRVSGSAFLSVRDTYTLRKNSVMIMCLVLRRSAIIMLAE